MCWKLRIYGAVLAHVSIQFLDQVVDVPVVSKFDRLSVFRVVPPIKFVETPGR